MPRSLSPILRPKLRRSKVESGASTWRWLRRPRTAKPSMMLSKRPMSTAAVDLLKFSKTCLNKFYNLKLYKPLPKRELSKLIDELIAKLKEDQAEDEKKERCESEIDRPKTKTVFQNKTITKLKAKINALDDGIRDLDKDMAEATENRKAEHDDFETTYAANTAAVDLKFAMNRLNKFCNPKLYNFGLHFGEPGFEKIIKLIDKLIAKLKEEQQAEDEKREWCESEIDKTEDTEKVLQNDVSNLDTAISDAEESILHLWIF